MAIDPRFTAYRLAHGLTVSQTVRQLLRLALDMLDRHSRGGAARAAILSPERRRAIASAAGKARWARGKEGSTRKPS